MSEKKPQGILKRLDVQAFIAFVVFAVATFISVNFFRQPLSKVIEVVLLIELALLVLITWGFAAHAVLRSLIAVSVELTLIIFISQAYCATPLKAHTANDALMSLVGVGVLYIGGKFLWTIYEEAAKKAKAFKEVNDNKWPWIVIIPFALFTGLFAWQVIQVMVPIIQNICVYKAG